MKKQQKLKEVRVIDRQECHSERAVATVINETSLLRKKVWQIRFESGHLLEVDPSEVEVIPDGL